MVLGYLENTAIGEVGFEQPIDVGQCCGYFTGDRCTSVEVPRKNVVAVLHISDWDLAAVSEPNRRENGDNLKEHLSTL